MSTIDKPNRLLRFSTRSYPVFGRGVYREQYPPAGVINSPYYWWFRFLQLNEDYTATAAASGVGKFAGLYQDLGDVRTSGFKPWWREHCHLFAEQPGKFRMYIAANAAEIAPFGCKELVNLVVPLTWSRRSLKKAFDRWVLSKLPDAPSGVHVEASDAKYKLSGKWNIAAMQAAYGLYTKRQAAKAEGWRLVLADAAIALGLHQPTYPDITKGDSQERRILTIVACRHLRRAKVFIEAAASSSFPHLK